MNQDTFRPLQGIRVLDLTHAYAGPFATYQLAALGAEVIKVEPPGGDEFRSWRMATFAQANAGKRSICLDLKSAEGREVFGRLCAQADVVVENLRPGACAKLGIDWPWLQSRNERLIFCSVSGYGQSGELRDRPAMEWSVQAMAGITALYVDEKQDPRVLGLSILDPFAGYMAFTSIMAALLERARTGRGRRLDISMFDAAWVLNASSVTDILQGEVPVSRTLRAASARFMCRDRRMFVSFIWPKWFETLCDVLDAPELRSDPRYSSNEVMNLNGDALIEEIERRLSSRDAAEWSAKLCAKGVPASPVSTIEEMMALHSVQSRGIVREATIPGSSQAMRIVGSGLTVDGMQDSLPITVPALGADTAAVLASAGFSNTEIGALVAKGVLGSNH